MDIKQVEKIKKLATIAMFSDDDLMEMLVLKGANALEIVHGLAVRTSIDLDFSVSAMRLNFKPTLRLFNDLFKIAPYLFFIKELVMIYAFSPMFNL